MEIPIYTFTNMECELANMNSMNNNMAMRFEKVIKNNMKASIEIENIFNVVRVVLS